MVKAGRPIVQEVPLVALLLAALFQSTAPVAAATPPSAPPAKAARLSCRKETVVGSTIKKKICPRKVVEVAQSGEGAQTAEVSRDAGK
jgi:hypothetical protein